MIDNLLTSYWLDYGFCLDLKEPTDKQITEALAEAVQCYAVKFGKNPTRALIHSSQLSDQLAAAANELGVSLFSTSKAYNKNRVWLSRQDRNREDPLCQKNQAQEVILCHIKNQAAMF